MRGAKGAPTCHMHSVGFPAGQQEDRVSGCTNLWKNHNQACCSSHVEETIEATMIPVEQSMFPVWIPWSAVTVEFLSGCQSAKITMASHSGSDRDNKIQFARRTTVSLRKTDMWPGVPFGRVDWSFFLTRRVLLTWCRRCPGGARLLGMKWLVIPVAPESRSRTQHGQCWIVAAETPPPALELNLPQGKAFITPSEGQKWRVIL